MLVAVGGLTVVLVAIASLHLFESHLAPRLHTISEYGTASSTGQIVLATGLIAWAAALGATSRIVAFLPWRADGVPSSAITAVGVLCLVAAAGLAVGALVPTQAVMGEIPTGVEQSVAGRLHNLGVSAAEVAFALMLAVSASFLRPTWLRIASLLGLVAILALAAGLVDVSVIGRGIRQRLLFAGAWLWHLAIVLSAAPRRVH
jgi:hypothetical protein